MAPHQLHQHHHHNTPNVQAPRTSRPSKPGSNKPFNKNANKKSTSAHKHPPDKTKSGGQQVPHQQGHQVPHGGGHHQGTSGGQHSSGVVNSKPQPLIGVVPLMPQHQHQQKAQQQQSPQQVAPVGVVTPATPQQQQNTLHSPQQQAEDTTPPKGVYFHAACLSGFFFKLTDQKYFSFSEKTPMCLINELARYNKIQHQYRLTDESGPAHKKTFTVCLKLGDVEEYNASGPSIKKAQHAAAAIALEKTKLKHPPPKTRLVKNSEYFEFSTETSIT